MAVPYRLEPLQPTATVGRFDPKKLIAEAEAEAERIRAAAREQGAAEGYAAGLEQAEGEVKAAVAALAEAASALRDLREGREEELLKEAATLALLIAEKVVAGALAVEPERIVDVVRGALRQCEERRGLQLLVNPDDLPLVEGSIDRLRREVGGLELLEVQGERRLGRGEAVVRTAGGELEATIAGQLQRAREG